MKFISYIVMYIDYEIALNIIKQITLITSSIIKLNLYIIYISKYVQRFKSLKFRYKSRKQYMISNALFRLN